MGRIDGALSGNDELVFWTKLGPDGAVRREANATLVHGVHRLVFFRDNGLVKVLDSGNSITRHVEMTNPPIPERKSDM